MSGVWNDLFNKHKWSILFKMLICVVIYSSCIVENLVNRQDGLWMGPYYFAGNWELSLGRMFIRYIDMSHFGLSIIPFTTLFALLFFVIGTEIFVDIFKIKSGTFQDYIVSFIFLSNMIVCISLSYPYTSWAYGLAFIFSMVCVKCILTAVDYFSDKNLRYAMFFLLTGAGSLAIVMGLYQAYVGCVTVVLLGYIIMVLVKNYGEDNILKCILCGGITGVCGYLFYEVILHIELKRYAVEMSDYNGANQITLSSIIENLGLSIKKAYVYFEHYYTGRLHYWNAFSTKTLIVIFALLLGIVVCWGILRMKKGQIILFIVFLLLFPMATNVALILAPYADFHEQQTAPLALSVAVLVTLGCSVVQSRDLKGIMILKKVLTITVIILLWGSIYQVQIDQNAMKEGTVASETMAEGIYNLLIEEELYSEQKKYAIIGAPCNNESFFVTDIYYKANGYAKVGGPWWGNGLDHNSWRGIFKYLLGTKLELCDATTYIELINSETVKGMPTYPAKNCVREIDGVVVIKVSQ